MAVEFKAEQARRGLEIAHNGRALVHHENGIGGIISIGRRTVIEQSQIPQADNVPSITYEHQSLLSKFKNRITPYLKG